MKIYGLTNLGRRLARSVSNPDNKGYRTIHFLDTHGTATLDQIAGSIGVSEGEASSILARLKRTNPPVVKEG